MDKEVLIYFYTGKFFHPLFREQAQFPPPGVSYLTSWLDPAAGESKIDYRLLGKWWFRGARKAKEKILDHPIFALMGIPQVRYIRIPHCHLVHSRHALLNHFPWVVEVEDATAFTWYRRKVLEKSWVKRLLERLFSSSNCRAILPWTQAARKSLENALDCGRFGRKIRVVYPAIKPINPYKKRSNTAGAVRFLFVGSGISFYHKGGLETLLAFEKVSKRRRDVSLTVVANVPYSVQSQFAKNSQITFLHGIPPTQLQKEFENADIFVLPTHIDTFGFVFLEAFANSLPCIAAEHFAVPEIINNGITGFLIPTENSYFGTDFLPAYHSPSILERNPFLKELKNPSESYVNSLADKMNALADHPQLRLLMSSAAYEEVCHGRFSVEKRRQLLSEIYEACLSRAKE